MNTPPDTALDAALDTALVQHLQSEAEPADDGFSLRVMAALPARAAPRRVRSVELMRYAQWTATSFAACGIAALMPITDGRITFAHSVAAYSLIGLLIFWAVPSRWSRG